ncbi:MAG TPA: tetratricopeptide repeat protein [Bacteroidales bacterium]|nr:tetratricopeptide repeat protein [Bacteroidales bacterium]
MRNLLLVGFYLLTCIAPMHAFRFWNGKQKRSVESVRIELSEGDRRVFDYYFEEAMRLRLNESYAEAFELFRHCTMLDSLNPQPWFELSVFYRNLNMPEASLGSMEKAHRLDPANEWYAFGLASLYMNSNRLEEAAGVYELLIERRPNDANLYFQLAELYARLNRKKKALNAYNEVERLEGKNEAVSFGKYRLFKEAGEVEAAIGEIESLTSAYPYDMDYMLLLGDAWMDLGLPDKAYDQYRIAREKEPANPSIALSLADYYLAKGDSLAADRELDFALSSPQTDVGTKISILTPLLVRSTQSGDTLRMSRHFDRLLDLHPSDPQIRELMVRWLLDLGNRDRAKEELQIVLDLNPNQLSPWKLMLELTVESASPDALRELCEQALSYFPEEPVFWFYKGLSFQMNASQKMRAEDRERSLADLTKAIEVANPEDRPFLSRIQGIMGDVLLMSGDTVAAYQRYEQALELFPTNVLVLNNYAYYLSESGADLSRAERMSRKTIEADPTNATFLDTFAWIYFKLKKYSLALIYMERAIKNEPNASAVLYEHYGDILWFNHQEALALEYWKKASEMEEPSMELLRKVETGSYVPQLIEQ